MSKDINEMNEAEKMYQRGRFFGDYLIENEKPVNPQIQDAFEKAIERSYSQHVPKPERGGI